MKAEFRRRLIVLSNAILYALDHDTLNCGLLPALYSVFSYMWCKSVIDIEKKLKNNSKI